MSARLQIPSIRHLACTLDIDERLLKTLASSMNKHVSHIRIPKSSGGYRDFYAPSQDLKAVQRMINRTIIEPIPLPLGFHGSVRGRSTITNAKRHLNQPVVASLDIKDFFPSIHHHRVRSTFRSLGYSSLVSGMLARLTTYDFHLAQGFPTSSGIANLALRGLWDRVFPLCRRHALEITLYVDDITISGVQLPDGFLSKMREIILQEGFRVSLEKSNVMFGHERQIVTGIVVNEFPNIPKEMHRELRAILHKCRVLGVAQAADRPLQEFAAHLRGRIDYVMQVNPRIGQSLFGEFLNLDWLVEDAPELASLS